MRDKRNFDSDTPTTEGYIVESYLRPQWGETPLNEIAQGAVQDWVDDLKDGKLRRSKTVSAPPSPGYIHRIYSVFNVSIKAAVKAEVLDASPCVGIELPKRPKRPKPYMTTKDAELLGSTLRSDYKDAVDFGLETGLRPNELTGMHASQADEEARGFWVTDVYVRRKKVIRGYPKDKDARFIPATDKAWEIYERRTAGRDLTTGCGIPHSDGAKCRSALVFLTVRNRPMNQDTLGYQLRTKAQKLGTATKSPYSVRRGFATRGAEGGMNAFELADVMGHSDIKITQEYVQRTRRTGDRMRAALAQPAGESTPRRARLKVIKGRGTGRGIARSSHRFPSAPKKSEEDAS
ncbi:tyrosine-type recombinase/integrase [Lentzea sp. BCCO 10_0798]|uniref:Tyrosine-type recombinase/integrase n=1 Tax=Lentzea kristufekii TaxID=3095430 RepID=A0ABU4TQ96_9PSEU|nr:tyrosine-type recombinase/integrase [Lentzea sp. BCCO 10_0798]MDX8050438.1 tyrosine-type recombinase/integrase [Lentzea sp. BCCO 10_0798]